MADIFSKPSAKSDVVLIVEDRRVYVNKTVLGLASPVFEAMFESDFKEKQDKEIPLPGKKYDDFVEFLLCFYPHSMKPVTLDNVDAVLPLADEFQTDHIKRKSEETLLNSLDKTSLSNETLIHILLMADKYLLNKARVKAVDISVRRSYEKLATFDEFKTISLSVKCDILLKELHSSRKFVTALVTGVKGLLGIPILGCHLLGHAYNCQLCATCETCINDVIEKMKALGYILRDTDS